MSPSGKALPVRLSLGPIQYYWGKEKITDFYRVLRRFDTHELK